MLRTAAEQKDDDRVLLQIRDKDCVAIEVCYHRHCYEVYTKDVYKTTEPKK